MAEPKILVVSCFFSSDSLVGETVRTFGKGADLHLIAIETDLPVPEIARPHLVDHTLGLSSESFRPCKKWSAVTRVLEHIDVEKYDYVIFPDDDLEYGSDFAGTFFPLLERYDVGLAQPALTPDSFHTWDICVRKENVALRYTNFVEIMAPCFRRDALAALRPTLASDISPMGYGFDLHWPYACTAAGLNMAIVDGAPIAHRSRPTGTHYTGDDLHHQGYAYGERFPRILPHEIAERRTFRP